MELEKWQSTTTQTQEDKLSQSMDSQAIGNPQLPWLTEFGSRRRDVRGFARTDLEIRYLPEYGSSDHNRNVWEPIVIGIDRTRGRAG